LPGRSCPLWISGPAKADDVRNFDHDAESHIGAFTGVLMAEAKKKDWVVISMKTDWKKIFAFEQ
jgi:hypothetical protein